MTNAFRVAALALAALLAGAGAAGSQRGATELRPNVLVIETDDQTVELMRVLPNVRRLIGDQGVTFDSSFVNFSLCCPSRSTLLTGQYAHNHGVLGNQLPSGGYEKLDGSQTLAVWLRRAGYYTVHLGKYLNGYGVRSQTEVPPGWSEWHGSVDPTTYRYTGYTLNEDGKLTTYEQYQTDLYAEKASEIVRRRAAAAEPYFLWVAFVAPHSGGPFTAEHPRGTANPAPRHLGRLADVPLPRPPSFNEADVSDKPASIRALPPLTQAQIEATALRYRLRAEALLAVDEAVVSIFRALEQSGELDRTLVIFTSDNGFFDGEHRVADGKVLLYEPSIRVPLLVRGPGVPKGIQLKQPVSNADLAPTILDAAKASAGRTLDGRSLLPLFREPELAWGRDLLIEGPGRNPASRQFTAIRTPRFLYAEYRTGERELYDLVTDPDELRNRQGDPALAAMQRELVRRLAALRDCVGSACRAGPVTTLRCVGGRAVAGGRDASWVLRVEQAGARARILFTDGRVVTRDFRCK